MKVRLIHNNTIKTIELQSNISEKDIKAIFPIFMGVEYNENCSHEIMKEDLYGL